MQSIDIFDTALFRDVYLPTDIFKLVEAKIGGNFYNLRIQAERSIKTDFYTIDDIYKNLPFNKNEELNMEFQHVHANPKILEMYNQDPDNFVFISDMYLDHKTLERMLSNCGYKNPRVFVSCEEKCLKGSGVLFEKVERRVGKIEKHYGDNYVADIMGANKVGITPIFSPALHNRNLQLPAVKNPMLKKYAAELKLSKEPTLNKLAKYYAPLIFDFTKWVLSQRQPGQSIYFLSRDMFMPYVISHEFLKAKDVYYLYASRRSLAPMFIKSNEKPLIDKMNSILTPEEFEYKKNIGIDECLKYLIGSGIKNNDIIVDIGYSGSTQRIIEKFLNIKLNGLYIQLDCVPSQYQYSQMKMKQYLSRCALTYRFLCEFVFTSPEDCIEGYKDGKPYYTPDNEIRKKYANTILRTVVNAELFNKINKMRLSLFDVEQMLIHVQNYPDNEMLQLFNEPILTNREKVERGINFDREAILKGYLKDCYDKSYAQPLFKKMLEQDPELSSLVTLL